MAKFGFFLNIMCAHESKLCEIYRFTNGYIIKIRSNHVAKNDREGS